MILLFDTNVKLFKSKKEKNVYINQLTSNQILLNL